MNSLETQYKLKRCYKLTQLCTCICNSKICTEKVVSTLPQQGCFIFKKKYTFFFML